MPDEVHVVEKDCFLFTELATYLQRGINPRNHGISLCLSADGHHICGVLLRDAVTCLLLPVIHTQAAAHFSDFVPAGSTVTS